MQSLGAPARLSAPRAAALGSRAARCAASARRPLRCAASTSVEVDSETGLVKMRSGIKVAAEDNVLTPRCVARRLPGRCAGVVAWRRPPACCQGVVPDGAVQVLHHRL